MADDAAMRNLICILSLLYFCPAFGQTFQDCSTKYSEQSKKVRLDLATHKIKQKACDSLRTVLESEFHECVIGKVMGDYRMVGRSGNIYTPETLRGKVVLFNFWTVNCGHCIVEIPMLNRLASLYKENHDFLLISVLLNDQDALDKLLQSGLIRGDIKYDLIVNDKKTVKENFGFVQAYPTNLFVDKQGRIYKRTTGAPVQDQDGMEEIRSVIDLELLK